jgi:hypothetical protein
MIKNEKILIVDDIPGNLVVLKKVIQNWIERETA